MDIQKLRSELFSEAARRGLGINNPIPIVIRDEQHNPVVIYVSYEEPYEVTAPFNIIWLVADVNSNNYKKFLQRNGRVPASNYPEYKQYWLDLTEVSAFFSPKQIWDIKKPENWHNTAHTFEKGNAHGTTAAEIGALPLSGGSVTGDITSTLRVSDFSEKSLITKEVLDYRLRDTEQKFGGFRTGLAYVLRLLKRLQVDVRGVVQSNAELNTKIENLGDTAATGVLSHKHFQEEPALLWEIGNFLKSGNLIVQIFDEKNNQMLPSAVDISETTIKISFAVPERGFARILQV